MNCKLTLLSFIICLNFCSANDTLYIKNRTISIHIGPTFITLKDKILTPLIYEGGGLLYGLSYNSQKKNRIQELGIYFSAGELNSSISTSRSHYIERLYGGIEYAYLKKIKGAGIKYYLGGAFHNTFSVRTLNLFQNNSEISGDITSSINLSFLLQKNIKGKHYFQYQFRYPLIAYIIGRMRHPKALPDKVVEGLQNGDNSPSIGDVVFSGNFLTVNKYIDFNSEFKYSTPIGKRIHFSAAYMFRYIQFPKLKKYQFGRSEILIGLNYKF